MTFFEWKNVFGTILTTVVTVMQVYVFWRAASVPSVTSQISRRRVFGIGFVLWGLFFLSRVVGDDGLGILAAAVELCSMTWMAMLFLISVALLAVDAITGFGFFLKRFVPMLRGTALIVGGLLSAVALVQGLRAPVMEDYPIYIPGLPARLDGTVIVALSDLHLGTVLGDQWLAARVKQVQAQRPDLVVLLGDIFEGHGMPREEHLATLRRLTAPQGVWGVLGNHESHTSSNDNEALFKQAGVHLLRNNRVELRPGLVLAGVDDLSAMHNSADAESTLTTTLLNRPLGATILLSHAPVAAELAAAQGVNLMLSGHTHAGQIWPFSYIVRQRFPLFEGRHEIGGMTIIVSRGTGTWGPRMRLWRPAEIVRVTLHSETNRESPQL